MSWALRHDPVKAGLTLDTEGWVPVVDVLAALGLSRSTLDAVVEGNDKRRFAVVAGADGVERIRASQGHSVQVDLGLAPSVPPPTLFHGTASANLPAIRVEGLRAGRRHHVHLSTEVATAQAVGRRWRGPTALLTVDASAMSAEGHVFYVSANGVWLTEHVPPRFLSIAPDSS